MSVPERDTSASATQTKVEYDDNIDMSNLLDMTSQMGQQSVFSSNAAKKDKTPEDEIVFCTRKQNKTLQPQDVRSEACEQKMQDFFVGEIDVLMEGGEIKFTDALLQTFPQAIYIAGNDRNPLSFQKCCAKMEQGVFEEDKYKVNKKQKEESDDEGQAGENGITTVTEEDNAPEYIHDERCSCPYCGKFNQDYIHELDIFSRIIWVLKMHEQENHADFKALYIYGARTTEDGLYEGKVFCLPEDEEDNLDALLKEIQKQKAAKAPQ